MHEKDTTLKGPQGGCCSSQIVHYILSNIVVLQRQVRLINKNLRRVRITWTTLLALITTSTFLRHTAQKPATSELKYEMNESSTFCRKASIASATELGWLAVLCSTLTLQNLVLIRPES